MANSNNSNPAADTLIVIASLTLVIGLIVGFIGVEGGHSYSYLGTTYTTRDWGPLIAAGALLSTSLLFWIAVLTVWAVRADLRNLVGQAVTPPIAGTTVAASIATPLAPASVEYVSGRPLRSIEQGGTQYFVVIDLATMLDSTSDKVIRTLVKQNRRLWQFDFTDTDGVHSEYFVAEADVIPLAQQLSPLRIEEIQRALLMP